MDEAHHMDHGIFVKRLNFLEPYEHSKENEHLESYGSQHREEGSTHSPHGESFHSHSHRKESSHSDNEYEKKYRSMGGERNNERMDHEHGDHDDIIKQNENILFKSQNENLESMEGKAFDVGLETLNIIEHMEMLNSRAVILSKNCRKFEHR